ncbi:hypothetical protein pdam_00016140 [Pocillopora damicornis]|uniref:Uncharacterized protein n=1 Tax=Pocillopora damicornis TaxID=46731 RepID=A0A3M6UTR7_POCDA|nr:hypothetical protein pdam_00016140 [Pocillopora damicornis]
MYFKLARIFPGEQTCFSLQFVFIVIHATSALCIDCGFSAKLLWTQWLYCISLILLFSNFYLHAYLSKKKKSE